MLRTILTTIGIGFFVAVGIWMIVGGDSEMKRVGWLDVIFFGGMGSLAYVQTKHTRTVQSQLTVSALGIILVGGCSFFCARNANLIGDPQSLINSPAVVRVFGFVFALICITGGFVLLLKAWQLRWLPETAEDIDRLTRQATQRWQDRTVMTRAMMEDSIEQMNGVIHCFSPFYFDIRGPATPPGILIKEWVESRKPEWFDVFLEIIVHPPTEADELWHDSVFQLLRAWETHDPEHILLQLKQVQLEEMHINGSEEVRQEMADYIQSRKCS